MPWTLSHFRIATKKSPHHHDGAGGLGQAALLLSRPHRLRALMGSGSQNLSEPRAPRPTEHPASKPAPRRPLDFATPPLRCFRLRFECPCLLLVDDLAIGPVVSRPKLLYKAAGPWRKLSRTAGCAIGRAIAQLTGT